MEDRQIVLCGVNVPNAVGSWYAAGASQKAAVHRDGQPRARASVRQAPPLVTRARASSSRWRGRSATTSPRRARTRRAAHDRVRALRGGGGGGRGAAAQVAVGEAHARCAAPGRQRGGARDAGFQKPENHAPEVHARGGARTDMPGVDYVFSLSGSERLRRHAAPRAGGAGGWARLSSGVVTSVVTPEEGPRWRRPWWIWRSRPGRRWKSGCASALHNRRGDWRD